MYVHNYGTIKCNVCNSWLIYIYFKPSYFFKETLLGNDYLLETTLMSVQ